VSATTLGAVVAAIERVYDPCSLAVNAPLNLIEMGLVRKCSVDDDGIAHVSIGTTAPGCVLVGSILEALEEQIGAVPGVSSVELRVDTSVIWTPDLMTDEGRRKLDARRQESHRRVPVRPRQWMELRSAANGHPDV